jgi:hypothetical protein
VLNVGADANNSGNLAKRIFSLGYHIPHGTHWELSACIGVFANGSFEFILLSASLNCIVLDIGVDANNSR